MDQALGAADTPTVYFNVQRYDPEVDAKPRYDRFAVPYEPGMTVLQGLLWILDHVDGSLALRYSCREAACGSCAMLVNGWYRLACKTQVKDLRSKEITVQPLPHYPVIKDLVVDMSGFFAKYRAVQPYLVGGDGQRAVEPASGPGAPAPEEVAPGREFRQSPADRAAFEDATICILCGACTSSCPSFWTNPDYLGPAALLKGYRFAADTRDCLAERVPLLSGEDGIYRCHTIFNCTAACPKEIPITEALQSLKRMASRRLLGGGGGGGRQAAR
ncbi:MAG: succinate dehydrogenase iron-sulfur subunit [Firmicutes bacterium]|nr:succinate dehydrogenase iron-sulfur subunit [Bacillota bacterium]